jgi:uncharacterized protein YjhX (UPF0386 family)
MNYYHLKDFYDLECPECEDILYTALSLEEFEKLIRGTEANSWQGGPYQNSEEFLVYIQQCDPTALLVELPELT